ncbi:hypothetical protein BD413DRAFT_615635 [Trametes elegans]|nr:hypothetical protein BD413DRAFT_615635 [Trametes elegans]
MIAAYNPAAPFAPLATSTPVRRKLPSILRPVPTERRPLRSPVPAARPRPQPLNSQPRPRPQGMHRQTPRPVPLAAVAPKARAEPRKPSTPAPAPTPVDVGVRCWPPVAAHCPVVGYQCLSLEDAQKRKEIVYRTLKF